MKPMTSESAITAVAMKRYGTKITVTNPPFPSTLTFGEMVDGPLVFYSDIEARDQQIMRLLEKCKALEVSLYYAIEHGDEAHRAWLKEELDHHFNNCPHADIMALLRGTVRCLESSK